MNLPNWNERSIFTAHLLNPAFCGELIRRVASNYAKKRGDNLSFALLFFILPLLLHKKTREKLPKSTRTKVQDWLLENEILKIDLIPNIKYLVPYTRESLIFLYNHEVIDFASKGTINVLVTRNKSFLNKPTMEIDNILTNADFLGRWMATFPEDKLVYSFFGVKP